MESFALGDSVQHGVTARDVVIFSSFSGVLGTELSCAACSPLTACAVQPDQAAQTSTQLKKEHWDEKGAKLCRTHSTGGTDTVLLLQSKESEWFPDRRTLKAAGSLHDAFDGLGHNQPRRETITAALPLHP